VGELSKSSSTESGFNLIKTANIEMLDPAAFSANNMVMMVVSLDDLIARRSVSELHSSKKA
jgi:hypothetical protein